MNNKIIQIAAYLGIFFITTGVSYASYGALSSSTNRPKPSTDKSPSASTPTKEPSRPGFLTFDGPLTETCPINGVKYTKEERSIWEQRRPLLVMIENHSDARPQSGLQNADIVYEAVAEGAITRFMGVFYCGAIRGAEEKYDVGPVRSARTYFLDYASEYADYPLYTHVGGANCSAAYPGGPCTTAKKVLAIEQIAQYGWNNKGTWGDLSQFSLPYKVCRREYERTGDVKDTEHTMYCSTQELWNVAASRGLTNTTDINKTSWDKNFKPWKFEQADKSLSPSGDISYEFWTGYKDYDVSWKYNAATNDYTRYNGGQPHVDFNTSRPLVAKNVVVMLEKEERAIDSHGHNWYQTIGTGKGYLYQNGTQTEITWYKANRTSRTIFKDKTGKEVNFVPGLTWISILPMQNVVTYASGQ